MSEPRIHPCKKCGSTDVALWDCGYSSFNPGGGRCKGCGYEVKGEAGCMAARETLIAIWNAGQILTAEEQLKRVLNALYGDKTFNYMPDPVVTIGALKSSRGSLRQLMLDVAEWAEKTFPGQTAKSKADHLADEASELADDPTDGEEMADVLLLLLHIAHMGGVDLMLEARKKLEINKRRQWGAADARGVHHHM